MKAYCIVYEFVDDPGMFEKYREQVMPTIEAYGGRFVVRGGKFTVLEGATPCDRIAVLEFPSRKAAEDWYQSPAYQRILPLRLDATRCSFVIADGLD